MTTERRSSMTEPTCQEWCVGQECGAPAAYVVGAFGFSDSLGAGTYIACELHAHAWPPSCRLLITPQQCRRLASGKAVRLRAAVES